MQSPPTVLVANDEPNVLDILRRLLEREGYGVVTASDGRSALELALTARPDVIISDVVMPLVDGVELCRLIKADRRTEDVPVILMSAQRTDDDASLQGLIAGADDYLGMPFRTQELMVKVARLAERHRVENYYRNIFEQSADIVYTCDAEGRITGINKAGERFFGCTAEALVGKTSSELFGRGVSVRELFSTEVENRQEAAASVREASSLQPGALSLDAPSPDRTSAVEPSHVEPAASSAASPNVSPAASPAATVAASPKLVAEAASERPAEASAQTEAVRVVHHVRNAQGVLRYLEAVTTEMRDARGAVVSSRSTARDVTERVEAEQRLQEAARALSEQAEREALINRITRAVRRSLDPAEVFAAGVGELGSHMGADRCVLFMLDAEAGVARGVAEYVAEGIEPTRSEYSIPLLGSLIEQIREHGVLAFDDVTSDERIRPLYETVLRHLGTRSVMYAAIRVGDETPAAFAISTMREARRWRASDVALARAVADQTGIAIRQAELFALVVRAKRTWEATFDAMSDGVFIFDNARRLARVNRAGAALEGTSPQALLGRACCDILHAGEDCIVERAMSESRAITMEFTPGRLKRPLLVTAEPLREGANLSGTVCTVRDLSELRRAQQVARERQSLLENILESAREAIYALDTEGRLQWCNSASLVTSGYSREELTGRHFLDLTYEADRPAVAEHFRRALAGEPQAYEMRYIAGDGQVRYAFIDNAPLVIEGRITGVLGISHDITEQKQERERVAQSDKLRALGQLASGVAHDFNNALAAILGRAQLLRRTTNDPEIAHSLDIIQTAAEDAAATVRRISTFARQSHEHEFERLDVAELLRDAVEITRTRWENEARSRGLQYDVRLDAPAGLFIEGLASELREVFVNMIVNALDAMPRGGALTVTAQRRGSQVRLRFADTGAGMTPEVRERIFEPFYSTKGSQGTGLGLFVSYGIVERHRGSLAVESEAGRGTTFTLDLPAAETSPDVGDDASEGAQMRPLSVLVVDDEPFVRDTLVDMLSVLGHDVEAAEGGRAALDALDARSFDLVFTDLSMPGMDGWEVAREIRRRFGQRLRLVIVTGYGRETTEPEGEQHLVDGVIGKPFDFRQVEETITHITGR